MMRRALLSLLVLPALASIARAAEPDQLSVSSDDGAVVIKHEEGKEVLRYNLKRPEDTRLSVDTACFFHPLTTPSGIIVTEVGPADHPHHRGVFLAWVEMHGQKDADFWGWGEHAPTKDRRIVNREMPSTSAKNGRVGFTARNEWTAEGARVLSEELSASLHIAPPATVLDLSYTLTPDADLTLTRWAFSGFCVRTRKDCKLQAFSPQGLVNLPNPSHVKPDTDWPDQPWYGYTLTFDDGKTAGVAVLNHPKNPPTLWHNHRDVRMLNPCIVAPAIVKLQAGKPLTLRYRVIAHDGSTPTGLLNQFAAGWE